MTQTRTDRPLLAPSLLSSALLLALACACSSESVPPGGKGGDGGQAGGSAQAEGNWPRVKAWFGELKAVAGRGEHDSLNEWRISYEDGPAIAAELSRPHIALADDARNVYIADKEAHAIRKVTPDGIIHTVAGINLPGDAPDEPGPALDGGLSNPNGLWVQPDGTYYIVDLDNAKIRKVTPDGTMSTLITLDRLAAGRGLWVAPDESEAFIADGTRLLRWTPKRGTETYADQFVELGMVLKDDDGRVLVGDRGGHRVYSIGEDGKKIPIAGTGTAKSFIADQPAIDTPLEEPRAIWPFAGGLFVGLHNACKIIYFDDEGYGHLFLWGTAGTNAGNGELFDSPGKKIGEVRSVSITSTNELLFVESDAGRVRVVAKRDPDATDPPK